MTPRPPEFLLRMQAIAASLEPKTLDAELGLMCQRSLFFDLRQGRAISQADIDRASHAFITATERLMPPAVLHGFIQHSCATRILPQIDKVTLVPGFTADEALAGSDAGARAAQPVRKFTQREVLASLDYAEAEPSLAVAIAHFVELVQTYAAALANFAGRRTPVLEEMLQPFVFQWSPKNVLKFVHAATYVAGVRRAGTAKEGASGFDVDQALLSDAIGLLNKSGAFTWSSRDDAGTNLAEERRIHCPAQAFLHKVIVNQGSLMTVLEFVRAERRRAPVAPELDASLAFVRATAAREREAVRTHGASWSDMALRGAHA